MERSRDSYRQTSFLRARTHKNILQVILEKIVLTAFYWDTLIAQVSVPIEKDTARVAGNDLIYCADVSPQIPKHGVIPLLLARLLHSLPDTLQ